MSRKLKKKLGILFRAHLTLSMTGFMTGLTLAQTVETRVAKICPTSAMTDSVKGIPMMANKMQKARPGVVTGAMLP